MNLEQASDLELLEAARGARAGGEADRYLEALYRRYYPKVAYWCLRFCGDRDRAADLAQEVFLRVHSRIGSFRLDSAFSTWLYTVTRRVAINQGIATQRRDAGIARLAALPDTSPEAQGELPESVRAEVREALRSDLEPREAAVLYLHFVNGMTFQAIDHLLGLENKSGAKAFVVSGMRKLRRKFGSRR